MRTKPELVRELADRAKVTEWAVSDVLGALADLIHSQLAAGKDLKLPGVGFFEIGYQAARRGVAPATGLPFETPEKRKVRFRPVRQLKEAVR